MLEERSVRPLALLDLIEWLPPGAAVWRSIEPDTVWGLPESLLALLVDEIRVLRWEFERVNFKGKPKPPDPLPRPGVTPSVERDRIGAGEGFDTIEEFDAWYASIQAERRMAVPEIDARGRALPQRNEQGRFVSSSAPGR